jgi:hypothetical protein
MDDGFGRSILATDLRVGLQELNPDITFDAAENRPSEYSYVLKGGDLMRDDRGGVFYQGKFVASYDKGVIPEWAVWSTKRGYEEIRMADIERYNDTRVMYFEIMPTDPGYHVALTKAQKKDDNFTIEGGKVFRHQALRETEIRDKILRVGWRHTLNRLLAAKVPGVSVDTLDEKLGVRL